MKKQQIIKLDGEKEILYFKKDGSKGKYKLFMFNPITDSKIIKEAEKLETKLFDEINKNKNIKRFEVNYILYDD